MRRDWKSTQTFHRIDGSLYIGEVVLSNPDPTMGYTVSQWYIQYSNGVYGSAWITIPIRVYTALYVKNASQEVRLRGSVRRMVKRACGSIPTAWSDSWRLCRLSRRTQSRPFDTTKAASVSAVCTRRNQRGLPRALRPPLP